MRTFLKSFLLIFILSINIYSQQGWFWLNPLPQGNGLTGSYFFNDNTGYICGGYGTILFTTNSGNTFINKNKLYNDYLFTIYFTDYNTGFTAGRNGAFLKTTNAGNNWIKYSILNNQEYRCIIFINQYTGFICGNFGTIGKTTDSGQNWSIKNSNTLQYLTNINFLNQNTGFICGNSGTILRTTDSGENWQIQNIDPNYLWTITFIDTLNGFVFGSNTFYKTTNCGNNWQKQNTFLGTVYSSGKFNSVNLIISGNGKIQISTNSGSNWISTINNSNILFQSLVITGLNSAIVHGAAGNILKSNSYGYNWINLSNGYQAKINSIKFFDNITGGAAVTDGSILITTNGGVNWVRKIIDTTSNTNSINDLIFINNNDVISVSQNGKIYKSSNLGNNWSSSEHFADNLKKINFLNINTGYVTGDNLLLKTIDGGISWSLIYESSFGVNDFVLKDSSTIFKVTNHGTIDRSTNSGYNFEEIASGYNTFQTLFLVNNIIFAAGSHGFVIKSSNYGASWVTIFENEDIYEINDVFFSNDQTGYFSGLDYDAHGIIYKTTNSGENWASLFTGTSNQLFSIYFTSPITGYAAGSSGNIIKTTNGGGEPIGIEHFTNEIPDKFELFQNYPNPFNPSTIIKFSVSMNTQNKDINLSIYDITGRILKEYNYENLHPGVYSIKFDGTDISSGIYFYRIKLGNYIISRKMVLLK